MDEMIVLKGFIRRFGDGENLAIKHDCIAESLVDTNGRMVSIRYWVSDGEITLEQAEEAYQVVSMGGKSDCEFAVNYSDYTGYLWTDEKLKVGGHDLIAELENYVGKYLILEAVIMSEVGNDDHNSKGTP